MVDIVSQASPRRSSRVHADIDRISAENRPINCQGSRPALNIGTIQEVLMRITDVPFAVMRFQYEMARVPFQLIEEQVAARLGSEAPARLFYERSLRVLDATVGVALGDRELAERGGALVARRDARGRAANLAATATAEHQQVDDELKAKRDKAIKHEIATPAVKEGEIPEARIDAEERKSTPQKAATKRAAAPKRQADKGAAPRTKAPQAAKRDEQPPIQEAKQNATAAATSQLKDAQPKRSDAADHRPQADQIKGLADADKRPAERNIPGPKNQPLT
jgi:hypothetical protein